MTTDDHNPTAPEPAPIEVDRSFWALPRKEQFRCWGTGAGLTDSNALRRLLADPPNFEARSRQVTWVVNTWPHPTTRGSGVWVDHQEMLAGVLARCRGARVRFAMAESLPSPAGKDRSELRVTFKAPDGGERVSAADLVFVECRQPNGWTVRRTSTAEAGTDPQGRPSAKGHSSPEGERT